MHGDGASKRFLTLSKIGAATLGLLLLALAGVSLAHRGEFEPLERGHLVGQLVDEHLLDAHLRHEPRGQLA